LPVHRRGGLAAILISVALATLFLVWPLRYQTGWVRSQGEVTKVYVNCGKPFSILVNGEFGEEIRTPWIQEQCVRKARTRPLNIVVFALPLLALGLAGWVRGPYRRIPLSDVLRPFPKPLWWRRRSEPEGRLGRPTPEPDP